MQFPTLLNLFIGGWTDMGCSSPQHFSQLAGLTGRAIPFWSLNEGHHNPPDWYKVGSGHRENYKDLYIDFLEQK